MSTVKAAVVQMTLKADPVADSFDTIRDKMTEAHMALIEDAAKQGVQAIGLQEVWTMPYFPAEIDERWFGTAEEGHVFRRGKHKGEPLAQVAAKSPDYLRWMLGVDDMDEDVLSLVQEAVAARAPPELPLSDPTNGSESA